MLRVLFLMTLIFPYSLFSSIGFDDPIRTTTLEVKEGVVLPVVEEGATSPAIMTGEEEMYESKTLTVEESTDGSNEGEVAPFLSVLMDKQFCEGAPCKENKPFPFRIKVSCDVAGAKLKGVILSFYNHLNVMKIPFDHHGIFLCEGKSEVYFDARPEEYYQVTYEELGLFVWLVNADGTSMYYRLSSSK